MKLLLLIGDTSLPEALGGKLLQGANKLSIQYEREMNISYHSPTPNCSPSMKQRKGNVFYRLSGKRSCKWLRFQRFILKKVEELIPGIVLPSGILPLRIKDFMTARRQGGKIINYLTDAPWNPINRLQSLMVNLPHYHHIFATKSALQSRLKKAGTPSTSWVPFAYAPELHYEVQAESGDDILFVEAGERERLYWLNSVGEIRGIQRRIYGNHWDGIKTPGWEEHPAVIGEAYCKRIRGMKVELRLLRQANGDQSTNRSYEIGAIGGCGVCQDTNEHRKLLKNYPNEDFFKDPTEKALHVKHLLSDTDLKLKLRSVGSKTVKDTNNTCAARLGSILKWSEQ